MTDDNLLPIPRPHRDPVAHLVDAARSLSIADPDVAIRRPLADVVAATLDAAGRSQHTRRAYETALALFVDFLDAERGHLVGAGPGAAWRPFVSKQVNGDRVAVSQDTGRTRATYVYNDAPAAVLRLVDAALVDGYAAHRRAQGDSANTVTTRLAAVKTLLAVALRDGILTTDQATSMGLHPYRTRHRRDVQPVGRRLSKEEVRQLREAVDTSTPKGRRDLAILDLGLYAGLRESEIAGLRMVDVQQHAGRWWVIVRGKGDKTRRVKLHDVAYASLTAWQEAAGLTWHDERPVFYAVHKGGAVGDQPLTATDVGRVVAHYGAAAGLAPRRGQGRLGAHDLRRTCARNAYDHGCPLPLIQALLGHADVATTMRYIGTTDDGSTGAVDFVRY